VNDADFDDALWLAVRFFIDADAEIGKRTRRISLCAVVSTSEVGRRRAGEVHTRAEWLDTDWGEFVAWVTEELEEN
jgi:hypothetical protein